MPPRHPPPTARRARSIRSISRRGVPEGSQTSIQSFCPEISFPEHRYRANSKQETKPKSTRGRNALSGVDLRDHGFATSRSAAVTYIGRADGRALTVKGWESQAGSRN